LFNNAGDLESLLFKLIANLGSGDFFNNIGATSPLAAYQWRTGVHPEQSFADS